MYKTVLTTIIACTLLEWCVYADAAENLETNGISVQSVRRTEAKDRLLIRSVFTPVKGGTSAKPEILSLSLVEEQYLVQKGSAPEQYFRYHLFGNTNRVTVSHAIWSPSHLSGFTLLSITAERTLMFWLDGYALCFVEVTDGKKSIDKIPYGMTSAAQADHVINLSLFDGSEQFFGTRADNCELGIVSAEFNTNGNIAVITTNIFGKTFRFSNAGGKWQAFGDAGEIRMR